MGDLTTNISRHELKCKCGKCQYQSVDFETISIVQEACDHFAKMLDIDKVILTITSAHRCPAHNAAVGGGMKSQHMYASAMDIDIDGIPPEQLFRYLDNKYPDRLGLGLYRTFVHIDTRRGKARW